MCSNVDLFLSNKQMLVLFADLVASGHSQQGEHLEWRDRPGPQQSTTQSHEEHDGESALRRRDVSTSDAAT